MRYIALFFPAILSVRVEYKKKNGETWNWFEYLYKYVFSLIANVLLTESLIVYVFKITATIDAFDSFPFFTKYLFMASVIAILLPYVCNVVKENISVSLEIHRNSDGGMDMVEKGKDTHKETEP